MDTLEDVAKALRAVRERLDTQALEPDPDARAAGTALASPREIADEFAERVVTPFEALRGRIEAEEAEQAGGAIAFAGGQVAALLSARGNSADAERLLARLVSFAPASERPELEAARQDLHGFTILTHARWLTRTGREKRGRAVLQALARTATDPQIAEAARETLDGPRPIRAAPALFRINGCGVGMYGARDRIGDSVVATHCVSLLFVPVVPLTAYRVVRQGGGRYLFLAKEKLSPFATWWRRFVLASVVVLLVSAAARSYWNDPDRVAERRIDAARAAEGEGRHADAVAMLEEYVRQAPAAVSPATLEEAGTLLARLYSADLPPPLAPGDADRAERVIRRFQALPERARHGDAGGPMVDLVFEWCDSLSGDASATQQLRVRLLDAVSPLTPFGRRAEVHARRLRCTRGLADALAAEWPIPALELYLELDDDPQAMRAAGAILVAMSDDLTLLEEARPSAEKWVEREGGKPEAAPVVRALAAAEARAQDARRAATLAAVDPKALEELVRADPHDQEALAALSTHHLQAGDATRAAALLEPLLPPGRMTGAARELLAQAWIALDRLPEAASMLAEVLRYRLPRFTHASSAWDRGATALQERLIAKADSGDLPAWLVRQLQGKPVAEQRAIFQKWLADAIEKDTVLANLRAEILAYSDAVPLSLLRGRIALLRARGAGGDEKQAFLEEAEQAFLGVSVAAEGQPEYHLGLGQVYHRTGRIDKGDAEFTTLLDRGDPALSLRVAQAYRELGVTGRAREIALSIYRAGDAEYAQPAAQMMSLLADTVDERSKWLERCDSDNPEVRTSLLESRAHLAYRAGDPQTAAGLLREAIAQREPAAEASDAAANNVALAYQFLYRCTGDPACLDRARGHFETALALSPDQAIIVDNAAEVFRSLGDRAVLDHFVDADLLLSGDTSALLGALRSTELEKEVQGLLARDPDLRRCADLAHRAIVLAPQSAGGYAALLRIAGERDDLAGMRALRDELASLPKGLDTSATREARVRLHDPARIEETLAGVRSLVANCDRAVREAERKGDAKTAALARLERSANRAYLARVEYDREAADRAVEDARKAAELWPVLRDNWSLPNALLVRAAVAASSNEPALRRAWDEGRVSGSLPMLLLGAVRGEGGDAVARALAAEADCHEAGAALARAMERDDLGDLTAWVVGRILGDDVLTREGKRYFEDEKHRLYAEIGVLLDPGDDDAKALLALFG